jgi:putative transposase
MVDRSPGKAEGAGEPEREASANEIVIGEELPPEIEQRIGIIQELMSREGSDPCGICEAVRYGEAQREAARVLGVSIRSVQRMMKAWREEGIAGLMPRSRRDRGNMRISEEWQEFIVRSYRDGNRGSRRMSPGQVALRVKARAQEQELEEYPSHMTVYRILKPIIEQQGQQQTKRSVGWRGSRLSLKTRTGEEIAIEWSNQVWQVDHTLADVLVVDQWGDLLGRPWLTIVVDSYSRCIQGLHLGFDAPSAQVVGLALRHAILPKQYPAAYEMQQVWETYGLPQYLYTDGGKDFRSQHLERVATELGIVLCLRRKPSDGGIVERPFGTFNREFFNTLPGYTSSDVVTRSPKAEGEASLTLAQLERLLVRYIVDHYNQMIDARMGDQSRIGRWEAGRKAQLPLLGERELDICLMRRDRRIVYRNGYIQFANLTYQGEHLAAYTGESIILRYDPRDITTLWVYQQQENKEVFLTRAHAQGLETERISYAEMQAMSQRIRAAGKAISNQALLNEVRDREAAIESIQRQAKPSKRAIVKARKARPSVPPVPISPVPAPTPIAPSIESAQPQSQPNPEPMEPKKPVPYVRVFDTYEQVRREANSQ